MSASAKLDPICFRRESHLQRKKDIILVLQCKKSHSAPIIFPFVGDEVGWADKQAQNQWIIIQQCMNTSLIMIYGL